jgi:hypothetical protein
MTANNKLLFLQEQIRGFKESLSRNHTNTELCAHIRERIGTLENEMSDLEAQLENIREASHETTL